MPTLGPVELIVILVIVAMLFGVGKLPEVFGAVGKGIKEFRRNSDVQSESGVEEPYSSTSTAPTSAASTPAASTPETVVESPEPTQVEETTTETKPSETQ